MKTPHIALTWAILVVAIQPCYDVTGSNPNRESLPGEKIQSNFSKDNLSPSSDSISPGELYHLLRITPYYALEEQLAEDEQNALKRVIERAIRKVKSLLSVKRGPGPLLLSRNACRGVRRKGVNEGKCGKIHKGYTGEYCLDRFKIPDSHLEGFVIYDQNNTEPSRVYFHDGHGLNNTDFVLYVTSHTSDLCNPYKTSALAYASFCQLGEINRPLAGQVNFCPRNVKTQKFDEDLLYITSVHELLHALGFSSKLFDKFMKCKGDICKPRTKQILTPSNGGTRLITEAVVREMRNHFNCSQAPHFGGPLEIVRGKVTSHWDPYLMYSSVMGSKEQKPYATLIDRISLAVFEDSGWYKVDYSLADSLMWGKGQGCSFGEPDVCEYQAGFCLENLTGCHHLRLSKARCNVNPSVSKCGIFAADQIPCFLRPTNGSVQPDEIFSPASRCFMSSISYTKSLVDQVNLGMQASPRCYETSCEEERYYFRLNDGNWTHCPPGAHIEIPPHQGKIQCPSYEEICSRFVKSVDEKSQESESTPSVENKLKGSESIVVLTGPRQGHVDIKSAQLE